jgi:hypothetical protein
MLMYNNFVNNLFDRSEYYPEIFEEQHPHDYGTETYLSTLVRIRRNGIWYIVHVVNSCLTLKEDTRENTVIKMVQNLKRLMYLVQQVQHCHMVVEGKNSGVVLDPLQASEAYRLSRNITYHFAKRNSDVKYDESRTADPIHDVITNHNPKLIESCNPTVENTPKT